MIAASCSTIPERKHMVLDTINTIKNQVDRVIVNCGYSDIPKGFENVEFVSHPSRIPDQYKFNIPLDGVSFHLTFDDDLFYPPDYVEKHIDKQNRFGYSISCVHGSIFKQCPIKNFFRDRIIYHYKFDNISRVIDLPGTGTLCYQPSKIQFPLSIFRESNMADIFVALKCKNEGIPIIMIGRNAGWIRDNLKVLQTPMLYNKFANNCSRHTNLINEVRWR